ncbi:MAG: 3-phenylpropionate/trans-cinnamate dioxygenase ferredoxin reductase subunit [Arenicella sp.]|jgi:3-phenylpropionate/trans-cinnamate dioxygenase ferredoxin reductase subunit
MNKSSVIIIGASHAAAEACLALRLQGWTGRIIVVGEESYLPYHRPPLSKDYFQGKLAADKLPIKSSAQYESADIEFKLGQRVTKIDRNTSSIKLESGETLAYTKLILATGTRARPLPTGDCELPNLYSLRTLDDVKSIRSNLDTGKKLLIIGAGYIGLELAASAVKKGIQVTVLESMDRVLARVTCAVVSEFYRDMHKNEGVDLRFNVVIDRFEKKSTGETSVILGDGLRLYFDCVVAGIGVVPNSELAIDADIDCDNGITVDQYTQTSDKDIYAIGDCSNHPNLFYKRQVRLESVPNAIGQAKSSAASICGTAIAYQQLPWFWSDQYNVKLQTAGLFNDYDKAVVRGNIEERKFSVFYLKNGELIAIDSINSPAEFMLAKRFIPKRIKLSEKDITNMTLSSKALFSLS